MDVVEGGASVSFMHPFTRDKAIAFWRGVARVSPVLGLSPVPPPRQR